MLARLIGDEEGATAIEYGLIVALIAVASIIAFRSLGLSLIDVFNTLSAAMGGGSGGGPGGGTT